MQNRNYIKSDLKCDFQIARKFSRHFGTYYLGFSIADKIFLGLIIFILFSCASTPPSKTLPQAEVAVSSIDHPNYIKLVSSDIANVKTKLHKAKEASTDNKHKLAEHLSQQILVDVELIQIKSQRINVENEVREFELSITNLHKEIQWREPIHVSPLEN